jgi:hypothetical protein
LKVYKRKTKECSKCLQELEIKDFRKIKNRNGNFSIHHMCFYCMSHEQSENYWQERWNKYLDKHKNGYFLEQCDIHGNLSYEQLFIKTYKSRKKYLQKASCIQCEVDRRIKLYGDHGIKIDGDHLQCSTCKQQKHFISFGHAEIKYNSRRCIDCQNNRHKSKKTQNIFYLRGGISLTKEEYENKMHKQNNLCAICNLPDATRRLCVDHNHTTMVIRDLLCKHCNLAIGQLKDSSELLRKAADYLDRHNAS